MKQAYTEMLEGSLSNPDKRIWYAIWNMELKNDPGTIAGDFCFKGFGDDAAYPWGDAPVETIEAIVEVVQLPEEQTIDDSNSSTEKFENKDNWPDVEKLVNQRGDETTVYLLADGCYMDRINTVYIYDGKDTWTDESGVEWNKVEE